MANNTKSYSLRRATSGDLNSIKNLIKEGNINPIGLKWEKFVVAVLDGGDIVGCGQIKSHRDGSFELASIAVTGEWREKGIAREIIEFLLEDFGDEPLYLLCLSSMGPLYEKFGFSSVEGESLPKYFRRVRKVAGLVEAVQSRGETLLIMKRS